MVSTLDDCLDLVQQGSIAFAVGSAGFFYLSDQAQALHRWWVFVREQSLIRGNASDRGETGRVGSDAAFAGEGEISTSASTPNFAVRAFGAGPITTRTRSNNGDVVGERRMMQLRQATSLQQLRQSGDERPTLEDHIGTAPGVSNDNDASNSNNRRVTKVVVRCNATVDGVGSFVDGVTFYYSNIVDGVIFGGNGGVIVATLELREDEWISEVHGRCTGAFVHRLSFVTNLGNTSPEAGEPTGSTFCFKLPNGGAIGGLEAGVSINGWLRSVRGVIPVSNVVASPPETPIYVREYGIVRAHQKRVRKRLRFMHLSVIVYVSFLIFAMSGFVTDIIRGPVPLLVDVRGEKEVAKQTWRSFVSVPEYAETVADSSSFVDGEDMLRWAILDLDPDGIGVKALLVKEVVGRADDSSSSKSTSKAPVGLEGLVPAVSGQSKKRPKRTGIVRRFDPNTHGLVFDKFIESPLFQWFWMDNVFASEHSNEYDKRNKDTQHQQPEQQQYKLHQKSSTTSESGSNDDQNSKREFGHISTSPRYYIDEAFSPVIIYVCTWVVLTIFIYTLRTEWKQTIGHEDPVIKRLRAGFNLNNSASNSRQADANTGNTNLSAVEISRQVDEEVLEEGTLVLSWSSCLVAVTRNWLIKTSYLSLDAIAISDARLVDLRISGRWIMGELVDIVTLRIESRRSVTQRGHHRGRATYFFDVALPRTHFNLLQGSFIDRINRIQEAQVREREDAFKMQYKNMLRSRACEPGGSFPKDGNKECLGACGKPATVVLRKQCETCEERDLCPCEPSWCHECLLRWWFAKNRTKIEIMETIDKSWQATCPQCRTWFCLSDVLPREDLADPAWILDDNFFNCKVITTNSDIAHLPVATTAEAPMSETVQVVAVSTEPTPVSGETEQGQPVASDYDHADESESSNSVVQRRARAAFAAERRLQALRRI